MNGETKGINAVKAILEYNPYINTEFLKGGEKYPSFDGELLIYNNVSGKKEGLNRVNVQIKSQESSAFPNAISYSVDCVDLNNYMRLGGCVYFVVRYNDKKHKKVVYYSLIYPITAKTLLGNRKKSSQSTITIALKVFPEGTIEQSDLLLNFAYDCIKQTSYVSSYSLDKCSFKANEKYEISYSTYDKTAIAPEERFLGKQMFVYRLSEEGVKIPFDIITFAYSSEPVSGLITVNNVPYYTKYSIVRVKDKKPKVFLNASFYFVVNIEENKITYTYDVKGTLKTRIRDLEFLVAAMGNCGFEVNGHKLDFEFNTSQEYYKQLSTMLDCYRRVQQALDIAGVTDDLDYDKLTKKDFENVILLEKIFLKKEALYGIKEKCVPFSMLRFGNISIPLYITKYEGEDKKFKAVNVFDSGIVVGKTDEDIKNGNVSVYCTTLRLEDLETISNLDYDKMYNQIVSAPFTEFHLKQTNDFLLQVILLYDKRKQEKDYNFAYKIAEWLGKYSSEDYIFTINYLQLKLRKSSLDIDDISQLVEICKGTDRNDVKFACLILLGKQEEALKYFYQLSGEERNYIKTLPIYKFVKTEVISNV